MADYTLDNDMASIVYELSDRAIYNDVRAELGILTAETIVDADPTYAWQRWKKYQTLPAPGFTTFAYFTATLQTPISWRLVDDGRHVVVKRVISHGGTSIPRQRCQTC